MRPNLNPNPNPSPNPNPNPKLPPRQVSSSERQKKALDAYKKLLPAVLRHYGQARPREA